VLHTHRVLATENLVLRQQLAVLKQRHPRPRLTDADRLFWVALSSIWPGWREALHIVQPAILQFILPVNGVPTSIVSRQRAVDHIMQPISHDWPVENHSRG
jgi:hypothetical protein